VGVWRGRYFLLHNLDFYWLISLPYKMEKNGIKLENVFVEPLPIYAIVLNENSVADETVQDGIAYFCAA
jgi:hypothetical protein